MSGAFRSQEPHCPQHPRKVPNIPARSLNPSPVPKAWMLDAAGGIAGRKVSPKPSMAKCRES